LLLQRRNEEVNVVRHENESVKFTLPVTARLLQHIKKEGAVGVYLKTRLPIVAALDDMHREPGNIEARGSWHEPDVMGRTKVCPWPISVNRGKKSVGSGSFE